MLALLLAALGLYGVTAGAVARRASSIEPAEVLREQ
jgi:ABC-type lipoprotein release transport system permease subunit